MLLVESSTGKISGVGSFEAQDVPHGYYLVDGPYEKGGQIVSNVSEIADEVAANALNAVLNQRKEAYRVESDPLYIEWQYDKSEEKEQVWRGKVAEIKERYPLP